MKNLYIKHTYPANFANTIVYTLISYSCFKNPIQMYISLTGSLLKMSNERKGSQLMFIAHLLQAKCSARFSKNAISFSPQNNSLYQTLSLII